MRRASVRAFLILSFTVLSLMVTVLAALTHAWFFLPAIAVSGAGVLGTVWGWLDIWVAHQIAAQRDWGSGTHTAWANAAGTGRPSRRARRAAQARQTALREARLRERAGRSGPGRGAGGVAG
ncbi:hypothetical protein [Phaeacidiphilus oryzae]|uniref:hypothetical protein n=1 Tax=Phaeacidiphilus oryzae TaxID=348818 RepID=UPI00068CF51C|nr:hypothetical protein [Phaeacidiphilus oryzae]